MPATVHRLRALEVGASRAPSIRVTVLGSLTIDGRMPTLQQRGLVSALALHAEHGATLAHLTDAIWPHGAPASARSSVQNQIARLRRTFGGGVITHDRGRYLLGDATDLDAFDLLTGRWSGTSPSPASIDDLSAALELWRGEPFEDLPDDPAADVERVRRQLQREQSFEALATARLMIGDTATAIGELTHHTASTPFHERPWELLLLALHLAGRRSDGLLAFRRHESMMLEQLGVEPSRSMRRLREVIVDEVDLSVVEGLQLIGIELPATAPRLAVSPTATARSAPSALRCGLGSDQAMSSGANDQTTSRLPAAT